MSSWMPLTVKAETKKKLEDLKDNLNLSSFSDIIDAMVDYVDADRSGFEKFLASNKQGICGGLKV